MSGISGPECVVARAWRKERNPDGLLFLVGRRESEVSRDIVLLRNDVRRLDGDGSVKVTRQKLKHSPAPAEEPVEFDRGRKTSRSEDPLVHGRTVVLCDLSDT